VLVAGVLSVAMMREWITLMGVAHRFARIVILDLFIVFEFVLYWFLPQCSAIFWAAALFWFAIIPLLAFAQAKNQIPKLNKATLLLIGYFSLLVFFAGLLQLRATPKGDMLVLMAFVIVWCADSIAYVVGRLMGKHKLISTVSPGKTWEGFIGAAILTMPLLAAYWIYLMEQPIPSPLWYVGMMYLVIMALVGDLFESLIKRMHKVKDSGTLLPGHGGLLDRFDSLMAVAPVFALLILLGSL
jgi:phosphatidate cytidylyltransferase